MVRDNAWTKVRFQGIVLRRRRRRRIIRKTNSAAFVWIKGVCGKEEEVAIITLLKHAQRRQNRQKVIYGTIHK